MKKMSKNSLLIPEHVAAQIAEDAQKEEKPSVETAYVPEDKRVLDPSLVDKSLKERLPQPTGWRILVMPYQGKATTVANCSRRTTSSGSTMPPSVVALP